MRLLPYRVGELPCMAGEDAQWRGIRGRQDWEMGSGRITIVSLCLVVVSIFVFYQVGNQGMIPLSQLFKHTFKRTKF